MQIGDLAWFGKRLAVVVDIYKAEPPSTFFPKAAIKLFTGEKILMKLSDVERVDKELKT